MLEPEAPTMPPPRFRPGPGPFRPHRPLPHHLRGAWYGYPARIVLPWVPDGGLAAWLALVSADAGATHLRARGVPVSEIGVLLEALNLVASKGSDILLRYTDLDCHGWLALSPAERKAHAVVFLAEAGEQGWRSRLAMHLVEMTDRFCTLAAAAPPAPPPVAAAAPPAPPPVPAASGVLSAGSRWIEPAPASSARTIAPAAQPAQATVADLQRQVTEAQTDSARKMFLGVAVGAGLGVAITYFICRKPSPPKDNGAPSGPAQPHAQVETPPGYKPPYKPETYAYEKQSLKATKPGMYAYDNPPAAPGDYAAAAAAPPRFQAPPHGRAPGTM